MRKVLPFDCPRGLNRFEAARYIGVSASTFDKLVSSGAMPQPKSVGARKIFDRAAVDVAFDLLDMKSDDEIDDTNDFDHILE